MRCRRCMPAMCAVVADGESTLLLAAPQVLILAILGMNVLLALVNDTFAKVMEQAKEASYVCTRARAPLLQVDRLTNPRLDVAQGCATGKHY